jgi:5S rRNA maturation endonuclease (ribonuclease M5)
VNTELGVWECKHCGWKGGLGANRNRYQASRPMRIYTAPQPPPSTALPTGVVEWFASRGIPDWVLADANITAGREFSPSQGKDVTAIRFPYTREGALVNIKYRAHPKDFWMTKGAERIFYGLDDIAGADEVCIVEGEMDKLTIDAVQGPSTVSVPDGAPPSDAKNYTSKLTFLDGVAGERLKAATRVILATDMDAPGQKLADELARRIGKTKCAKAKWPEGCKDANETLVMHGRDAVLTALTEAQPYLSTQSGDNSMPEDDSDSCEDEETPGRASQATKLVALARHGETELFHDAARKPYITFTNGTHRETWPLSSTALRDWLAARFYADYGTAPTSQALRDALTALAGIARFEGDCRPVFVRLAGHEDEIFLDLANEDWEVVRITAHGWDIIPAAAAPVRFRRPAGMLPLPPPSRGGNLSALRRLVNVKTEAGFALIVAWLLGALRPSGPYPMLGLAGEQRTAKTTLGRILRALIDPNVSPLRTEPRDEGDLLIAATNGAIVALDNLSHLPGWLSDALCRLATGGGLSKRTLYTDAEETLIDAQRPILLTGIETVLTRGDAVDRALLVELEKILDEDRRTEAELNAAFEASRPGVLGALLDAASTALRNWETTNPERLPRMADFARWVEAGAPALGWEPGYFLSIYATNRGEADEIALDALPIGTVVRAFVADRNDWEGTPTELLTILNDRAGETAKDRTWPKKAHNLSGQLKRLAPNLRRLGVEVKLGERDTKGNRVIKLSKQETKAGATQRQERQDRQDRQTPWDDAGSTQPPQRQAASRTAAAASSAFNGDPRHHAESGRRTSSLDAVDTVDAISVRFGQKRVPVSDGASTDGDLWAHATRERL